MDEYHYTAFADFTGYPHDPKTDGKNSILAVLYSITELSIQDYEKPPKNVFKYIPNIISLNLKNTNDLDFKYLCNLMALTIIVPKKSKFNLEMSGLNRLRYIDLINYNTKNKLVIHQENLNKFHLESCQVDSLDVNGCKMLEMITFTKMKMPKIIIMRPDINYRTIQLTAVTKMPAKQFGKFSNVILIEIAAAFDIAGLFPECAYLAINGIGWITAEMILKLQQIEDLKIIGNKKQFDKLEKEIKKSGRSIDIIFKD
jgi:hypothetical protein